MSVIRKNMVMPLHMALPPFNELNPQMSRIFVKDNYAFVNGNSYYVLVADLSNSFVSGLEDDVVEYLDGKYLTREYWAALMDATEVDVVDDMLHIKSSGKIQYLEYEMPDFILDETFNAINYEDFLAKQDTYAQTIAVSVSFTQLELIKKGFGFPKSANLILSLNGPDRAVKVFNQHYPGVFGIVMPNYEDTEDIFYREPLQNFIIHSKKVKSKDVQGRLIAKRTEIDKLKEDFAKDGITMEVIRNPKEPEINFDDEEVDFVTE